MKTKQQIEARLLEIKDDIAVQQHHNNNQKNSYNKAEAASRDRIIFELKQRCALLEWVLDIE